jgi:hypothetical protein
MIPLGKEKLAVDIGESHFNKKIFSKDFRNGIQIKFFDFAQVKYVLKNLI